MEIEQILDTSMDYLLFGIEIKDDSIDADAFEGKTEGQKIFMQKITKAVFENIGLLV